MRTAFPAYVHLPFRAVDAAMVVDGMHWLVLVVAARAGFLDRLRSLPWQRHASSRQDGHRRDTFARQSHVL